MQVTIEARAVAPLGDDAKLILHRIAHEEEDVHVTRFPGQKRCSSSSGRSVEIAEPKLLQATAVAIRPRWRCDRGGDATAVAMRRARGKTRTSNKSAAHGPRLFFACRRWPPLRNNCAVRVPRWNAAVLLEFHIRPAAQINDGRALPATSGPAIGRRVVNRDGPGSGLDLSNCFGPCSGLHTKFVRNDWQFCRQ